MRKGEKRPDLQRARVGICPVCSKSFRAISDFKNRKQKYCSKICWGKRSPPRKGNCLYCSKEFSTYEKGKKYCSKNCDNLHRRIIYKGKNSPLWEGGKTKENKIMRTCAAYREWRKAVFVRDNYRCIKCGSRSQKGKRVELNADHIKPLFKYKSLAYDINNGQTLCIDCHKITDTYAGKGRWMDANKQYLKVTD